MKFNFSINIRLDKCIFSSPNDVLYVCAYLPPESSPVYHYYNIDNGIVALEDYLCDVIIENLNVSLLISGGLNSRLSNFGTEVVNYDELEDLSSCSLHLRRCSQDTIINTYGKCLLTLCTALDLCILNGMCHGDREGCYTFISDAGSSVVDYFLMSQCLFSHTYEYCFLNVVERPDSDHMPIHLLLNYNDDVTTLHKEVVDDIKVERYIWKDDKKKPFLPFQWNLIWQKKC